MQNVSLSNPTNHNSHVNPAREQCLREGGEALLKMAEALGGAEKYVELSQMKAFNDYIPEYMPHSIMKGVFNSHSFVVLRLKTKDDGFVFSLRFGLSLRPQDRNPVWFLDGYNAGAEPSPNYASHNAEFRNDLIGTIRQIVVNQNHPRLELA